MGGAFSNSGKLVGFYVYSTSTLSTGAKTPPQRLSQDQHRADCTVKLVVNVGPFEQRQHATLPIVLYFEYYI